MNFLVRPYIARICRHADLEYRQSRNAIPYLEEAPIHKLMRRNVCCPLCSQDLVSTDSSAEGVPQRTTSRRPHHKHNMPSLC